MEGSPVIGSAGGVHAHGGLPPGAGLFTGVTDAGGMTVPSE